MGDRICSIQGFNGCPKEIPNLQGHSRKGSSTEDVVAFLSIGAFSVTWPGKCFAKVRQRLKVFIEPGSSD